MKWLFALKNSHHIAWLYTIARAEKMNGQDWG
jgi:hypothetical protein